MPTYHRTLTHVCETLQYELHVQCGQQNAKHRFHMSLSISAAKPRNGTQAALGPIPIRSETGMSRII